MSNWQKVKIGDFLFERKGRYKPNDEQIANLPRIEKISDHSLMSLSINI